VTTEGEGEGEMCLQIDFTFFHFFTMLHIDYFSLATDDAP